MKAIKLYIFGIIVLLWSVQLAAQQTTISIENFQYSSESIRRTCRENFTIIAYFDDGSQFSNVVRFTQASSFDSRQFGVPGIVTRLEVVTSMDIANNDNPFSCFLGNFQPFEESFDIPFQINSCSPETVNQAHTYGTEGSQSYSFDYDVFITPEISITNTFDANNQNLGYEEFFTLSSGHNFEDSAYIWQYRLGAGDWISLPYPTIPTRTLRLIDFIESSYIEENISFRITSCDNARSSNIVTRRIREYGQLTKFEISDFVYDDVRFKTGFCRGQIRITAFFVGGGSRRLLNITGRRLRNPFNLEDRTFYLDRNVERIEVYLFGRDEANNPPPIDDCRSGNRNRARERVNRYLDENEACNAGQLRVRARSSNGEARMRVTFNYKITPLPRINRPTESNIVGFEDTFILNATEGFNNNVYDWQYSFLEGEYPFEWTDLPGTSQPSREIVLADFFDESLIGRTIYFRTSACDNQGTQNIVGYEVRHSAPFITNVTTKPVSCYGPLGTDEAQDGAVTLRFNRALREGETVSFSVTEERTPGERVVITNENNVTVFTENDELTINGLPPSTTEFLVEMVGGINGVPSYTEGPNRRATLVIERPTPVAFAESPSENTTNVFCHGGQDGTITLNSAGGVGNYSYWIRKENEPENDENWIPFDNPDTHTITGLEAATYRIKIRDANGCVARVQEIIDNEIQLGDEIVEQVVITEPNAPLAITTEILNEPTAFGFEDGRIVATITGGTPNADNSYNFEWRNQNNTIVTTTNATYSEGQGYVVFLHSVGEGVYTLTATDANFEGANSPEGCTSVSEAVALIQPEPIEIIIDITPISCNATNTFSNNIDTNFDGVPDQFQDGVLIANVTGGVPFDTQNPDFTAAVPRNEQGDFLPYFYQWEIQNPDGSWEEIPINNAYIEFLDTSTNYSVNVTDKNGISLGRYTTYVEADGSQSYQLSEATPAVAFLPEPEPLQLQFEKTEVTCINGNDARIEAIVTGGVPPYTFEWNNGASASSINQLIAGTYFVFISDANGCEIQGNITIEQPDDFVIEVITLSNPTCFDGDDGQIRLNVSGGTPPYQYLWNTGSTTSGIDGLREGLYNVEITDASGCSIFYEEILEDPEPVEVNLADYRALCAAQVLELDITIEDPGARYQWTADNGFNSSSPNVSLSESGTYTATITSRSGCVGSDSIIIEAFETPIDANYYVASQTYVDDDIVLVNVSDPIGEFVEWDVPKGCEVLQMTDEALIVRFDTPGSHTIKLRSIQGDCSMEYEKNIIVAPSLIGPEIPESIRKNFIETFIVFPNPNRDGNFTVQVGLKEVSNISMKILNLSNGHTMHQREESGLQEYDLQYGAPMAPGVYLLLLETPYASETRKLIFE